ncbi:MAG: SUMF1/EgtB/PvdO family nonheme iron enzyme [Rudaea sp.]
MPGSDIVQKQSVLGGIAGIAILAFALAYRFYPNTYVGAAPGPVNIGESSARPLQAARDTRISTTPSKSSATAANQDMGPPAILAMPAPPPPKAIAALLKKAGAAFERGRLLERKDGALALYRQVLDADPKSAPSKAGVERVHDAILQQANDALDRGDEGESARLIAVLQDEALDEANIVALQGRLKKLRLTSPLLTQAANLLRQLPAGDGDRSATDRGAAAALGVYRQIVKVDAANKLADQGMAQIERIYLDRALAAAAQDDFSGADRVLDGASSIRPGSHELLDTRTQIEGIRHQRATAVMTQANSALDAGNADLAQLLEQKALGLSPDVAGVDAFGERLRNARLYASFKPGQVITDRFLDRNGRAPALVIIPTGAFRMGASDREAGHRPAEEPQREVQISSGFGLGRDEISVGEFRNFVEDADYTPDANRIGSSVVYDEDSGRTLERRGVTWRDDYTGAPAAENLPVVHVSWNDAVAFANWLSARTGKHYRLPSEAEYEYALRAGSTTRFWWGDGNPSKVVANLTGDGDKSPSARRWSNSFPRYNDGFWGPSPIGKFTANPFGLRDVDGNVSNWVEDCWHDSYLRAPADSRAWVNPGCARHVVRGASWGSAPEQARSAFRTSMPTESRSAQIGIRVARDL